MTAAKSDIKCEDNEGDSTTYTSTINDSSNTTTLNYNNMTKHKHEHL